MLILEYMDKEKQLNDTKVELDNFGTIITNTEDLKRYQELSEIENNLLKEVAFEKISKSFKLGEKFSIENTLQNRSIKVEINFNNEKKEAIQSNITNI